MKKHKLIILAPAQRELEAIADIYSHLAGMDSAIKITDKILDALERLEAFPLIGILHHDRILRNQGYRTLVVDKYICVYRIIEKNISRNRSILCVGFEQLNSVKFHQKSIKCNV